jgi:hypothetical protein
MAMVENISRKKKIHFPQGCQVGRRTFKGHPVGFLYGSNQALLKILLPKMTKTTRSNKHQEHTRQ